jgi:hypothetical protein
MREVSDLVLEALDPAYETVFFEAIVVLDKINSSPDICDVCRLKLMVELITAGRMTDNLGLLDSPMPSSLMNTISASPKGLMIHTLRNPSPQLLRHTVLFRTGTADVEWWPDVVNRWVDRLSSRDTDESWTELQAQLWYVLAGKFTRHDILHQRSFEKFLDSHVRYVDLWSNTTDPDCKCKVRRLRNDGTQAKFRWQQLAMAASWAVDHLHLDMLDAIESSTEACDDMRLKYTISDLIRRWNHIDVQDELDCLYYRELKYQKRVVECLAKRRHHNRQVFDALPTSPEMASKLEKKYAAQLFRDLMQAFYDTRHQKSFDSYDLFTDIYTWFS